MHLGIRRALTNHINLRSCDRDQFTQTCVFFFRRVQLPSPGEGAFGVCPCGKVKEFGSRQTPLTAINKIALWTQYSARNSSWGPPCGLHTWVTDVLKYLNMFGLQYTVHLDVQNKRVFSRLMLLFLDKITIPALLCFKQIPVQ